MKALHWPWFLVMHAMWGRYHQHRNLKFLINSQFPLEWLHSSHVLQAHPQLPTTQFALIMHVWSPKLWLWLHAVPWPPLHMNNIIPHFQRKICGLNILSMWSWAQKHSDHISEGGRDETVWEGRRLPSGKAVTPALSTQNLPARVGNNWYDGSDNSLSCPNKLGIQIWAEASERSHIIPGGMKSLFPPSPFR